MKEAAPPRERYTPLPQPTHARKQMQRKYYIMRRRPFQAIVALQALRIFREEYGPDFELITRGDILSFLDPLQTRSGFLCGTKLHVRRVARKSLSDEEEIKTP